MAIFPGQYLSPITMNSRSIRNAYFTLTNRDVEGCDLRAKSMTISELANVLNFVEICTMSDGVFFDGTLPPSDVNLMEFYSNEIKKKAEWVKIGSINLKDSEKLSSTCKEAAEQASELILNIEPTSLTHTSLVSPIRDDISDFVSTISSNYPTYSARKEKADELSHRIATGQETFRGSKCAVGILLSQCEQCDLLFDVKKLLEACNDDDTRIRYLMGALIDRFRVNYISALSQQKNSAYLADLKIQPLKETMCHLLWKYILEKIDQKEKAKTTYVSSLFQTEYKCIPVGFAAFMRAKRSHPFSIFEASEELRGPIFDAILKNEKLKNTFLTGYSEKDFKLLNDDLFGEIFYKLKVGEKRRASFSYRVFLFALPVLLGTTAVSLINAYVSGVGLQTLISTAGALTVTEASVALFDRVLNPERKYNLYIDHFQKLEKFYETALSTEEVAKSLATQVKNVFNRKLIIKSI